MKRLALYVTATPFAAPAWAHGGAHMHPHGYEGLLAALAFIGLAVLARVMWRR